MEKQQKMSKKVLYLVDVIETGGAERIIIRVASELSEFSTSYLTSLKKSNGYSNYDLANVNYIQCNSAESGSSIFKLYYFLKTLLFLLDFCKKEKIDVVVSFLERSNVTAYLIGRLLGVKVVSSVRNNVKTQYDNSSFRRIFSKYILKYVYQRVDVLVSLSDGVACQLKNYLELDRKIITVPNPYPIEQLYNKSRENLSADARLFTASPYFSACGRLSHQKGFDHLLKVYFYYRKNGGKANLVILGEGEDREYLEGLISLYSLDDYVFLVGYRLDAPAIISSSIGFVFASRWEGFGNAALESMAYQIPLLSVDCDFGPREILELSNVKQNYPIVCSAGILTEPMSNVFSPRQPLDSGEAMLMNAMLNFDSFSFSSDSMAKIAQKYNKIIVMDKWKEVILAD